MTRVALTQAEVYQASCVGQLRQLAAIRSKRQHRHGSPPAGDWQVHIEGACGELAVAKFLGVYWSGNFEDLDADDVGPYQVRTTGYANGCLLLHKSDPPAKLFVLVTGGSGSYRLAGWLQCSDGQQERYWRDKSGKGRPAFFVPQGDLLPMAEFPHG